MSKVPVGSMRWIVGCEGVAEEVVVGVVRVVRLWAMVVLVIWGCQLCCEITLVYAVAQDASS